MAERELPWPAARNDRRAYLVRELRDLDEIRSLLTAQVEYAAYALGQLEPGLYERSHWYAATGDAGRGLVVHSKGGLGEATFAMGEAQAIAAILSIHPGPAQTFVTCRPEHLETLRGVYRLANPQPMMRMTVARDRFRPAERVRTIRLSGLDIRRVNALYSSDGNPTYYSPEHIDGGVYRGVVLDGQLVAIAGTHVVSPRERVAVVGNVFTHPAQRGRGYATATTSAVTAALLQMCDTVVLTVDPLNTPAVAAYERLGYREAGRLVEASAMRRDPAGIVAQARRLRAWLRGRGQRGSLVHVR